MKKLIFLLSVLLIAVPAMAAEPIISATCEVVDGNGLVTISYDANGAGEIRAFALDITVDSGAVITEAGSESDDYWVFPGTYDDDESVVAPNDDPGASGTGINTNKIVTEQGSLYAAGEDPPADVCDLLQFVVEGEGTVNVSIAENGIRGGVVLKDPALAVNPVFVGCQLELPAAGPECGSLTPEEILVWQAWGEPANWCTSCWKCGDVNGDGYVTFGDVQAAFAYFNDAGTNTGEGDVNMDGYETFGDVQAAFAFFNSGNGCTPCE